jgi:DNA-binding NarL/FixJ family response regulator
MALSRAATRPLTFGELKLLRCIVCGQSNNEIPIAPGIQPLTVAAHGPNV